ncbi:hypothetical protein [Kitasatospora sp. NPDC094015]|uniref:hypothetical protein n=1 Tax=Kitasatospora sp. NPDC094015 TaxID=3155205 RepID=UPI0033287B00
MAGWRVRGVLTAAGLTTMAAAVALLVPGAAVRAAAAEPRGTFEVAYPSPAQQQVPPGGTAVHQLALTVRSGDGRALPGSPEVAVDARALAGVAELQLPERCRFTDAERLRASCSPLAIGATATLRLGVRALPGAAAGSTGEIGYQVTVPGADESAHPGPARTTVRIADGPDLAARLLPERIRLGGPTPVETGLLNRGNRDATGVVLSFDARTASTVDGNHSNCRYPQAPDTVVVCRFDDVVVHPGEALRPATPVVLRPVAGGQPATGLFEYRVETSAGRPAAGSGPAGSHPGTGPALTLTTEPAPQQAAYGAATASATVEAAATGDLAAVATDLRAVAGTTTAVTFAVRNAGDTPAAPGQDPQSRRLLTVTFPEGLRVSEWPTGCAPLTGPTPSYGCAPSRVLTPAGTEEFTFRVEPLELFDRRTGSAVLSGPADASAADDRAEFAVTTVLPDFPAPPSSAAVSAAGAPVAAVSATTSNPARPVPAAAGTPTRAGTGGADLARTGGGDTARWTALGGAAAVGLGIGLIGLTLVNRRAHRALHRRGRMPGRPRRG